MKKSKKPVRVMFVTPCFGFGGLERVIIDIVTNIDRSRFIPSFCTLMVPDPDMFRNIEQLGLPCTILDKGEGFNYSLVFRLARLLKSERIDLVNSHDIGATLYAAPAALLAGIGRVLHTDHSQILTRKRYADFYRRVLRWMVTHNIAVSQDLADFLVSECRVRPAKVSMIPNGIDVQRFAEVGDVTGLRNKLGIADHKQIIGTIGRLMEQKGTEHLVRAYALLARKNPDAVLVIVGDGELRGSLERLARDLGVDDGVVFTGIREDVPELLHLFDIFVLPSLWEGQPITIMEAMAAGKPVVATSVGGNAEILRQGDLGVLVPARDPGALSDAIERLLKDRAMARQLGERARSHAASDLTSAVMTRRHEQIFESLFSY